MLSKPLNSNPRSKSRPRANTASFPAFGWRRVKDTATATSTIPVSPQSLPLEELIRALTPPAVPSLSHARALATVLSAYSPLPPRATLNPVLASLCHVEAPFSIQAAGYDILSAYCENNESPTLTTAERVTYFDLFRASTDAWAVELWEPRFKALRALTKYGNDVLGIEVEFFNVLKMWIKGGFQGLLKISGTMERTDRAEREHSIDILVKFLAEALGNVVTIARVSEEHLVDILYFYAGLVDQSILFSGKVSHPQDRKFISSDAPSNDSTPSRPSHRRTDSSMSAASYSVSNLSVSSGPSLFKHPADLAISIYLDHLSSCLKSLSANHLDSLLPLLFRSLAFCYSPLPHLSVLSHPAKKASTEDKITETLNALFSGPYSTTCMRILKRNLYPPTEAIDSNQKRRERLASDIQTSVGAHRTFRNHVRRALITRLARAYIFRETSVGYSSSCQSTNPNLERDMMERAWPKEDYSSSALGLGRTGWDAARLGKVLAESVGAWVQWKPCNGENLNDGSAGKEDILEEAAGVLRDIWDEFNSRIGLDKGDLDEEEACVIGETLQRLAEYIVSLSNEDGSPFILPLQEVPLLASPLIHSLSYLLSRDHAIPTSPPLSTILIQLADHLNDADMARIPRVMTDQHDLYPTSPHWLDNWVNLLSSRTLVSSHRPLTARAVMEALELVYESVRDIKNYRKPLSDLVLEFCKKSLSEPTNFESSEVLWKILGDEVVMRSVECCDETEDDTICDFLSVLTGACSGTDGDEQEDVRDAAPVVTVEHSPSRSTSPHSSTLSPTVSRTQSGCPAANREKEKDSTLPSVRSLFSSLTAGHYPRSQSVSLVSPPISEDIPDKFIMNPLSGPPSYIHGPQVVAVVSTFITIFSQLSFTPLALRERNVLLAIRIFQTLVDIASDGHSVRARVTALQFLMRLRADRCHRLYFTNETPSHVVMLSSLIYRLWDGSAPFSPEGRLFDQRISSNVSSACGLRRERDGRQLSRGKGSNSRSVGTTSRSRSRATTAVANAATVKIQMPLWHAYEDLPFILTETEASERLLSYNPESSRQSLVLPTSSYLKVIVSILEREVNWEVLSYVLCHLPAQLSNKHLFCGPNSRMIISRMLSVICSGILSGEMASQLSGSWPLGRIKARDAHSLAYHTLSVLLSYRRCFDLKQCHLLVEVFQNGLNGQIPAIKCCLHSLSLAAFELQVSMTKYLPYILEMLAQIMSNAAMTVHILSFLSVVVCLPPLYSNFTENDYKMVFGVALQYLQQYNRIDSPTPSWALSQYVRILSYFVVYNWFLAIKQPDRPRHVPYITRQLLLANEGKDVVDELTEVCFDWLSRYTYASTDPRPAPSVFSDIVTSSPLSQEPSQEKTWIFGYSVVTIRSLTKRGWMEILSRRPSGLLKFICRAENLPMVTSGDVDPDLFSIPAALMVERGVPVSVSLDRDCPDLESQMMEFRRIFQPNSKEEPEGSPNPLTGYVWSGTAPSQRRKKVTIDPSYLALQLTGYPESSFHPPLVADPATVAKFVGTLDRIPVIDTHKVGIMYVAPGQNEEAEILRNTHGSPAYTRFLEGLGRLINLRGQVDVYAGGLDPDEDGEYAYAWWDDIGQILYHTATLMPTNMHDAQCTNKKRHIGNDYVRIVWNDSGLPYRFDTLSTQFQFVNIIIEPHSLGPLAAFSNHAHELEYFKITVQRAIGMPEFAPVGHFKLISSSSLPLFVRQLSLLADWFASVFAHTQRDTERVEMKTNWQMRLESICRFKNQVVATAPGQSVTTSESIRDFTTLF